MSSTEDKSDSQQVLFEKKESRRTYLITYLQANIQKFPDSKVLSNVVLNAFEKSRKGRASVTK